MIKNIVGEKDFIEYLRGKSATFLLSLSNTETINIEGITQAGLKGFIHLTPTLDAEFVCLGEIRSLKDIPKTNRGVPTPALMTRAVHTLKPFKEIEILNLGLEVTPKVKYFKIHNFNIPPSGSIDKRANIDAEEVFKKGLEFGQKYTPKSDYIILAESVPAGTTTAYATAKALGYSVDGLFSSSFKDSPNSIKEQTVKRALENLSLSDDIFDILGKVSDNMLIFNAGFILGLNGRAPLILAGGTQMAGVLLIVNKILEFMQGEIDSSNLALATTKWVAEDKNSNIKALLEMLSFDINGYYLDFSFSNSKNPLLRLYDTGEAKEGVGAGASLVYGALNGLKSEEIISQVENFFA